MTALHENFMELFRGRTDAFGRGAGGVSHYTPTLFQYADHLAGQGSGLGIFPLLDDGTVWFGAIDLDEPNFELARALQRLIPGTSWIERSRSGNAHVWVFFAAPAEAWAVRGVLRAALESVGRSDVEIFPKQDRVREGGVGNYINLPYHGSERLIQDPDPDSQTGEWYWWRNPAMFVGAALLHRQDPDAWAHRARRLGYMPPAERVESSEFGTAPVLHECAAYIIEGAISGDRPLRPGHRHNVIFHLAKQLLNYRDMTTEEALGYVVQVNAAADSPLPGSEVQRAFRNAFDGRFTSTGCDDPVMAAYVHPDCPIAHPR